MSNDPVLFVIYGVSGDLAKRKLLPALYSLIEQDVLPEQYSIVGVSRQSDYTVAQLVQDTTEYLPDDSINHNALTALTQHLKIVHNPLTSKADLVKLKNELSDESSQLGQDTVRLYYLSVPPAAFSPLVQLLGQTGHNQVFANETTPPRLLVEKPFGYNTQSATELIQAADSAFSESQIYRIDHYLAKETAQNIMTFRFNNALFESIWNSRHIDTIRISAIEQIDIEGRANFYERTGALRDIIQSHLLQLLAITTMAQPERLESASIHAQKIKLLQAIQPIAHDQVASRAVRAQYEGYLHEVSNPSSTTETYARLLLSINNEQWRGTNIVLETGKALDRKETHIEITFKPYHQGAQANSLLFMLQPREAIVLKLLAKQPGLTNETRSVQMDFDYQKSASSKSAEAYQRVILDAIRGDQSLFASGQEVLASWRIFENVLQAWSKQSEDMQFYPKGSKPDTIL